MALGFRVLVYRPFMARRDWRGVDLHPALLIHLMADRGAPILARYQVNKVYLSIERKVTQLLI